MSPTRLVSTLAPLSGGGDLSADRVLSLQYGANLRVNASNQLDTVQDIATGARPTFAGLTVGSLAGYVKSTAGVLSAGAIADADLPATVVRTSRAIATSAPLAGGGDLSVNRSLSLQYTANLRVNASNQLDTVQDIGTGAGPVFAGLTVGSLAGYVKATAGVLSAGAIADARRLSGLDIAAIHVVGGGSRNELLCQLTADACGIPVIAGPVEATALGNVLVQARARGLIRGDLATLRSVVRATQPLRRYEPAAHAPTPAA